ncbi:MAG: LysE family translocator [Gillisia sp.]|nr:LysE family translocator [Gillisia sp.]
MIEQIILFLTASMLLTISPGPDIVYVLVQSMANGKKAGIITTLGLVSGIMVHTTLVAFGVSAIIKESETIFMLIKIFGALYLFFLAYKVFRSGKSFSLGSEEVPINNNNRLFMRGFIMNVLNPKVTIFFLAFFPGFLWAPEEDTVFQFYTLGLLFMLQAFIIFGLVALLAGNISGFLKNHPSSGVVLKWVQIVVFVGIGVFILI